MNDQQHGVPAASPAQSGGALDVRALVSVIERSAISIDGIVADCGDQDRFEHFFARSPGLRGPQARPSTPWAPRRDDTDIDTQILEWIISHVPSRKRLKAS